MASGREKSKRVSVRTYGKFSEDAAFEATRSIFPKHEDKSLENPFPPMDCIFYLDDRFEAIIDVVGFDAEDLIVTLAQEDITVEGKKEKANIAGGVLGNIAIRMIYGLPQKISGCYCRMSSDGVLVVTATWETPRKKLQEEAIQLMTEGEFQRIAVLKCDKYLEDERFEPVRDSLSKPSASHIAGTVVDIVTSQCVNTTGLAAVDCVYYHNDRFEAIVDARGFQPDDIVCTMRAELIGLNGKKRSPSSQSDVIRNRDMTRRYHLPEPVAAEKGACLLSSDGILKLELLNSKQEALDDFGSKKKVAFLDLLLRTRVDRAALSDEDIREEVATFMFEGHDTTASAISFALFLISNHPEVEGKLVAEQRAVFGEDRDRRPQHRDLQDTRYLEMVIKETPRLYPSAPFYVRQVLEDTKINDDLTFPAGLAVNIFAYGIQRDPKYYPEPESFIPERFSPEISLGKHPYGFIPFSAGSRNCIGRKFAFLETKATISKFLGHFALSPAVPEHRPSLISGKIHVVY